MNLFPSVWTAVAVWNSFLSVSLLWPRKPKIIPQLGFLLWLCYLVWMLYSVPTGSYSGSDIRIKTVVDECRTWVLKAPDRLSLVLFRSGSPGFSRVLQGAGHRSQVSAEPTFLFCTSGAGISISCLSANCTWYQFHHFHRYCFKNLRWFIKYWFNKKCYHLTLMNQHLHVYLS